MGTPYWKITASRRRRELTRFTRKTLRSTTVLKLAKIGFFSIIAGMVAIVGIFIYFSATLPSPENIVRRAGFATKIVDRNGVVLYDIYENEKRIPVKLDEITDYLKKATVSIEDKNFYSHQGFDPVGYMRAAYNIVLKRRLAGGSTLTQQLVKTVLLSPERTPIRKIKEFVLTLQVEAKYSKDQILEMYLNEMPYGGTTYGVEAAAETYFGKKADSLTLAESAVLAGLPQWPSYYSPYSGGGKNYVGRAKDVLRRMREDGVISTEEEETAETEVGNLTIQPRTAGFKAPHFVNYVQNILEDRYGTSAVETGGLKVTTTLDWDVQVKVEALVKDEIAKVEKLKITNGAAVLINPQTGEIVSMVGSKDFNDPDYDGQVNVTTSLRQPGSAIKPFTYVTAFKKGYSPSTLLMDVPTVFPGGTGQPDYKPVNYDGKFRGPVQVRYALANSINVPAVKMLALVGVSDMLSTAFDMGLTTLEPTKENLSRLGLSVTLGGGEVRLLDLTSAYSGFVNGGYRVDPVAILKVEDVSGKVLENNVPQKGRQVIPASAAYLIASILSDNDARKDVFGLNSLLNIPGRQIAVKTGTTNDKRDNWAVGGNGQIMIGVWVGNNDNSPMQSVASGVSGASPIWNKALKEFLKDKEVLPFTKPDDVSEAEVDIVSGYRSHNGFPSRKEFFAAGTEPGDDPVHVLLKVCKSDGNKATPADIASGNFEEKEFFIFKEEDPTAPAGGTNRWQEGILEWLTTQSDGRYKPPSEFCGTQPLNVEFDHPKDHDSNLSGSFEIKVVPASTSTITLVELYVDGTKVRSFDGPPFTYQANLANGVHQIRAVARDSNSNTSERIITVGVGVAWDWVAPTPTPAPTLPPLPTLTP